MVHYRLAQLTIDCISLAWLIAAVPFYAVPVIWVLADADDAVTHSTCAVLLCADDSASAAAVAVVACIVDVQDETDAREARKTANYEGVHDDSDHMKRGLDSR